MSPDHNQSEETRIEDIERLKLTVDIWKYVVSVQMHFNDMGMRIRNLYFTVIAASFGLVGVVYGKYVDVVHGYISIALPVFVMIAVAIVSMLFYFIDRHWYHRLLQGAVAQCSEIETAYKDVLPEIQLGSKISAASPVTFDLDRWRRPFFFISDSRFRASGRIHSDAKLEVLYKSAMWIAVASAVVYSAIDGLHVAGCPIPSLVLGITCHERPAPPSFVIPARQTLGGRISGHSVQQASVEGELPAHPVREP